MAILRTDPEEVVVAGDDVVVGVAVASHKWVVVLYYYPSAQAQSADVKVAGSQQTSQP